MSFLKSNIDNFIERIDDWLTSIPGSIVGYGAGGRGVMTLAQLNNSTRISALLDLAFDSRSVYTPKTHIPVYGPSKFSLFQDSHVLVFSYGYFDEIADNLVHSGFDRNKITSLRSFMS